MYQFKIGDKYTSDTWGLLLSSFEIGEPQPKTNYIPIPGGDGSIDLTEALTGDVAYENRTIRATFTMMPPRSNWRNLIDTVRAYCHGRKYPIVVPNDENHYYIGRVSVRPLMIDGELATFDVVITCDPYKYKNSLTVYDFTIGTGGSLAVSLVNGRRRAIPTLTVSNSTQVVFGTVSLTLPAGTHIATSLALAEGDNNMTFTAVQGTTIQVTYQEGVL